MKGFLILLAAIGFVVSDETLDPETGLDTPGIIQRWGYPAEVHYATTEDGYILTLHRIPYGKDTSIPQDARRPVVFLQHGLEASSTSFITNLPNLSLGFLLADMGYDVWMGNIRGNLYGKNHTTLDTTSKEFWDFTWDDMVEYDLPAMIDTALTVTNHSSLYYVGHSQGTLIMFAKLSSDHEFAKKIRKFFALAPVCTVEYIKGLLEFLAHTLYGFADVLYDMGIYEFLPDNKTMETAGELFCANKTDSQLCGSILGLIGGTNSTQMNCSRIPVFMSDEPAGTSTLNMIHWIQMVRSGKMQKYDYKNVTLNIQHYGQPTAPEYDISKINSDVYLFWSSADWLADQQDIEGFLLKNINPNALKGNNVLIEFDHLDFIWGNRAKNEVYKPIVMEIQKDVAANGDP